MSRFNRKDLFSGNIGNPERNRKLKLPSFNLDVEKSLPTTTVRSFDKNSSGPERYSGDAISASHMAGYYESTVESVVESMNPEIDRLDPAYVRRLLLEILSREEYDTYIQYADYQLSYPDPESIASPTTYENFKKLKFIHPDPVGRRIVLSDLRLATGSNSKDRKVLEEMADFAIRVLGHAPEVDEVRKWKNDVLSRLGTQGKLSDDEIARLDGDDVVEKSNSVRRRWNSETEGLDLTESDHERLISENSDYRRYRDYLGLDDYTIRKQLRGTRAKLDGIDMRRILEREEKFALTDEQYEYEYRRIVMTSFLSAGLLLLKDLGYAPRKDQSDEEKVVNHKRTLIALYDEVQTISAKLDRSTDNLAKALENKGRGRPPVPGRENYRVLHLVRMGRTLKEIAEVLGIEAAHRSTNDEYDRDGKWTHGTDLREKISERVRRGLEFEKKYLREALNVFSVTEDELSDLQEEFLPQLDGEAEWAEENHFEEISYFMDLEGYSTHPKANNRTLPEDTLLRNLVDGESEEDIIRRALIQRISCARRGVDPLNPLQS